MRMTTKAKIKAALKALGTPEKKAVHTRFFKTGEGEYGEGDVFFGVTVPNQRKVSKQFREISLAEIRKLLDDEVHECRLTALLILVDQFRRGSEQRQQAIFDLYVQKLDRVNNWDLVDSSADKIVGAYLDDKQRSLLDKLAGDDHLWTQRVAIIATYHFIKQHDFKDTLRISRKLLNHEHDLIHKAVGWMLREVGNRDKPTLVKFLKSRYRRMPRTLLRYAIEKFPEPERQRYLKGQV